MSAPYFYHPELALGPIELAEEEARHAIAVRRLFQGDELILVDGAGGVAQGVVLESSKRPLYCRVSITAVDQTPPISESQLAIAFPKADRALMMIDMLAQLGVRRVIPLITTYGEGDYSAKLMTKYNRVANGAMKQSRQSHQMIIDEPMTIAQLSSRSCGYYAHPIEDPNNDAVLPLRQSDMIAIGPEAGFSDDEVQLFNDAKWQAMNLGASILRIETAAVVLAAQSVRGDL